MKTYSPQNVIFYSMKTFFYVSKVIGMSSETMMSPISHKSAYQWKLMGEWNIYVKALFWKLVEWFNTWSS